MKTWNAFVCWTTMQSSRVLLSAAVPLKQSPCTEHRHQSGRQSAYNLSQIHWPTKSHCSTVLAFLTVTSVNGLFFSVGVFFFSSFPNPWYFLHQPSDSVGCPTCSTGHWECPVTLRHALLYAVLYWADATDCPLGGLVSGDHVNFEDYYSPTPHKHLL